MRFALSTLVALAVGAFAAPSAAPLTVQRTGGEVKPNSFIVKLKENVAKETHLTWLNTKIQSFRSTEASEITHPDWDAEFFHGFAGIFKEQALNELRASPDVEFIEEDAIMHTQAVTTETNAPWGLARLSQTARLTNQDATALTFSYRYDSTAGRGVDIYIVDTGINTAHTDFGGRARFGAAFGGNPSVDDNGHGTHVSGTAAGSRFGVAKAANLIAVKVLNSAGSGAVTDIVSGLNFVGTSARSSGRPSIASMSLGGSVSTALDNAVASLTGAGIHVTVAAGNSNADAANSSPARAPSAVTVGATTIADARASFSNFGSIVDIFAPGQTVTSAWIGSTSATNTISGTSMATPHIAGLIAYLIGLNGNSSPATMSNTLKTLGTNGAISGIPSGTANELARNNIA